MIGAIRQENGKYTLTDISYDNKAHSTYNYRDKIKQFGGRWDINKKRWIDFPEENLKEIGASKRLKIRTDAHDGIPEEDSYAYQYQIKENKIRRINMGDDWDMVNIIKIYGEQ